LAAPLDQALVLTAHTLRLAAGGKDDADIQKDMAGIAVG
jgi:hypothetical protein